MVAPQQVTLEAATPATAPLLSNLLQLYLHDLSEIFPIEIGEDGRFAYDRLPLYWSEPATYFAFLIRAEGRVASFALVTRGSPATADPEDPDVAEFFVLRSHRRSGVGRRAAFLLWDLLPGRWVVRVAEANRAGLPFWEKVVREYTQGAFSTTEHRGKLHTFRVFSFRSAAVKAAV
ncbi:MAG TPA: GNAT family N-acetyltransferase [Thermoanaerobaculia bacterium]|nr:GNAT family N-acetyltransferase [Thermoanaerobaculia bacterium]